ncbi:unnamed protein product [Vitrella brassicaformis CCMP3155]|uniref:mTERF domain-containing protein, mitochondrial n=1 Tax=Vitrella brassicaformis (strain CCMP3155) TaxID=1169540 RepID=A0A0G4EC99_VITBC|nr:unnamed protein product [Vitrella brassicaformis CCMP3155]|eukprot:CEL92968.1 unnamed protein product [Vitrella brassicaformis CCMP3155]
MSASPSVAEREWGAALKDTSYGKQEFVQTLKLPRRIPDRPYRQLSWMKKHYTQTGNEKAWVNDHVDQITAEPEELTAKMEAFADFFSFTPTQVFKLIKRWPLIINRDYQSMAQQMQSLGFSKDDVSKLVSAEPFILKAPVEKNVQRLEELFSFDRKEVLELYRRCPSLLKIGRPDVKAKNLWLFGFEYDQIKEMVKRWPRLLTQSVDRCYRPKMHLYEKQIKGDLSDIIAFPQYFSYGLRSILMPRIDALTRVGVALPPVKQLCLLSDDVWCEAFSVPKEYLLEARLENMYKPAPAENI